MQHAIPAVPGHDPRAAMTAAVSSCVHCGFCLPACPTYRVLGEEMDAPRGRIVLMKEVLEGTLPLDEAAPHLERCLGCLACETACPSGVRYRDLIEPMRARLHDRRRGLAGTARTLLLALMTRPAWFRLAAALGAGMTGARGLLPSRAAAMLDLVPARLPAPVSFPAISRARGRRRGRVALMTGCVQHVLAPGITDAAITVLTACGVEVVVPGAQGCCGALALHSGAESIGRNQARAHAARFPADVDAVIATAAGCGSSMKATHGGGAPVRDLLEYLDALGPGGPFALPAPMTAAYQDACHLAHAQQITEAPRRLLRAVSGLSLVPVAEAGLCCGSAGLYNVDQPGIAADLGRRKAEALAATGASMAITANIGCLLQIRTSLAAAGHALPVRHAAEVLAMALPGARGRQ